MKKRGEGKGRRPATPFVKRLLASKNNDLVVGTEKGPIWPRREDAQWAKRDSNKKSDLELSFIVLRQATPTRRGQGPGGERTLLAH